MLVLIRLNNLSINHNKLTIVFPDVKSPPEITHTFIDLS